MSPVGGPDGLRDQIGNQLDELDSVIDRLLTDLERRRGEDAGTDLRSESFTSPPVDSTELAGGSGQAQENRAIRLSRTRDAREQAQLAATPLAELSRRVRDGRGLAQGLRDHTSGPVSGEGLAEQLHAAMDAVAVGGDPGAVVSSVAAAVLGFDGVDHATVCLRGRDGVPRHTAGSDEVGTTLAEIQDRVGQGPCVEAAATGRAVQVDDICSSRSPWPAFGAAAVGLGVIGVVAVPLRATTSAAMDTGFGTGSLTLWTRRSDAVSASLVAIAELFARYAGLAVAVAVAGLSSLGGAPTGATGLQEPAVAEEPVEEGPSEGRAGEHEQYGHLTPVLVEFAGLPEQDPRRAMLREQLVRGYRPVVEHIARRFRDRGEPLDDLEQAGALGLVNAVNRFDPDRGGEFLAFAVPTITGEIRRHFRDRTWSLKVPRTQRDLFVHLNRAQEELANRLHRAPRVSELAEHLQLSRDEMIEALAARQAYSTSPLDPPGAGSDMGADTGTASDWAPYLAQFDQNLAMIEAREMLRPAIEALPERDRVVLFLRFFGGKTQTQIGDQIGVSQMQVSRILARTLQRLRTQFD